MPAFAEARNYRSSAQDFCIVTSARYNEVLSRDRVLITMIGCRKQRSSSVIQFSVIRYLVVRDFLSIYLYFLIIRCSVVMSALKIKVELHSVANKKQPRIDSFFTG